MASYSNVTVIGNLTRDPELRYIPSGTAVCDIGLAVNDRVKKGDQWVDETTFLDVTLWARTAEVANEYLKKGSSVFISGKLKSESWEKDGQKRTKLKVVGDVMQLLGSKPSADRQPQAESSRVAEPAGVSDGGFDDDDSSIPF